MPMDYEALKNKKARTGQRGWQAKDGPNVIRILPHTARYFTEVVNDFAVQYNVHFIRVEKQIDVTLCPREVNQFCACCELYWAHRKSDDPALAKAVDAIKPVDRYLMNMIDLNNAQAGLVTYEGNYTVYHGLRDYVSNIEWGDVLDPRTGRNFTINLTPAAKSETKRNKYAVWPAPQPSDVLAYLPPDWLQRLDQLETAKPEMLKPTEIIGLMQRLNMPDIRIPAELAGAAARVVSPGDRVPPPPAAFPPFGGLAAPGHAPPPPPAILPPPPAATPYAPPATAYVPPPAPPAYVAPPAPPAATPTAPYAPPAAASAPPAAAPGGWPPSLRFNPGERYPTCFGHFDPQRFPCDFPCPARVQCQMKVVGIG